MKKVLFAIAVVSIIAFASSYLEAWGGGPGDCYGPGANQGNGPGGRGFHGFGRIERLKEFLSLSDDQVQRAIRIDSEYRSKYYTNRGNFDKITALRTEHRRAIENILTDTQKTKLNEFSNNWQGRGHSRSGACPWR